VTGVRRRPLIAGIAAAIADARIARAQASGPTIGMLSTGGVDSLTLAFFKGLTAMGFEEGRNLTVVRRSAAGQFDKLPALAQELVGQKVDAIAAIGGPGPTRAAKAATTTIPIVFAYGGDPVNDGLVASFNRPGGNVTGASFMGASFTSKRLQVLKQLIPQAADVVLMLNPKAALAESQIRDARDAAPILGQAVEVINADGAEEIDAAFAEMNRQKTPALLVGVDPSYGLVFRDRIIGLAAKYKLPALYDSRDYVEKGGLISYGSVLTETWRQAGLYVGRILKGEKPQDLPVVQPTRFETLINLKTAKALGLEVPAGLLALADDTID
jgi:putative ABC transport system substrate-binding protein